ncbi:cupin domain-containing protein [Microbacterium halophytorum]|uniref:cupin domain-containing protein n=1 Tax=Microbacterium halophytorum TaxID=2067568 RepID=UPI00131A3E79|nr:cupin domain-containing protein [Microbacterium halophytorum]
MTEQNDRAIDKPFHSAGETIEVLARLPLADVALPEGTAPLEERTLRMRKVVVESGGVIAAHPHANRPTILYIMTGRLLEFSSSSDTATEYTAPAIAMPKAEHWWRNPGDTSAIIIGADLLDPAADAAQG